VTVSPVVRDEEKIMTATAVLEHVTQDAALVDAFRCGRSTEAASLMASMDAAAVARAVATVNIARASGDYRA
jgi:hypothetical protein